MAITGLIFGYVGVVLLAGFMGLGFYGMRMAGKMGTNALIENNEKSVVSSVRSLNTAEIAYAQAHHAAGYTCSLTELSGAWGISAELARGRKDGYVFALQDCTAAKDAGPIVKYRLVAYPTVAGKTGTPAYCSDESDIIRVAGSGSADECLRAGITLSERELSHVKRR